MCVGGGGSWLVVVCVVCVGGGGGVIRDANSRVDIFMQSGNINHIDIANPNIFIVFLFFSKSLIHFIYKGYVLPVTCNLLTGFLQILNAAQILKLQHFMNCF